MNIQSLIWQGASPFQLSITFKHCFLPLCLPKEQDSLATGTKAKSMESKGERCHGPTSNSSSQPREREKNTFRRQLLNPKHDKDKRIHVGVRRWETLSWTGQEEEKLATGGPMKHVFWTNTHIGYKQIDRQIAVKLTTVK